MSGEEDDRRRRRDALNLGTAAYTAARKAGDKEAVARILEEMQALRLLVRGEDGVLRTGPDVAEITAADREHANRKPGT